MICLTSLTFIFCIWISFTIINRCISSLWTSCSRLYIISCLTFGTFRWCFSTIIENTVSNSSNFGTKVNIISTRSKVSINTFTTWINISINWTISYCTIWVFLTLVIFIQIITSITCCTICYIFLYGTANHIITSTDTI